MRPTQVDETHAAPVLASRPDCGGAIEVTGIASEYFDGVRPFFFSAAQPVFAAVARQAAVEPSTRVVVVSKAAPGTSESPSFYYLIYGSAQK